MYECTNYCRLNAYLCGMLTNRQLFFDHVAQTSETPLALEITEAKGMYLHAADGRRYMDLIAGISVSTMGHSHPKVVSAVKAQAERYMHLMVYGEFIQSPQTRFAKALADLLPQQLSVTYFTNSGSEAIEGAMKLAKRFTGRPEIVSFKNAYHGSTQGSLSIMGSEMFRNAYRPLLPATKQIGYNVIADFKHITEQTACVIVETIQGEAGAVVPDASYLAALRAHCSRVGALLVADEIQCGFGRTGTMFAFEQYGFVPDILCLAKSLGGGMPLGAFISSQQIMSSLTNNPVLGHITTFGGHPVCCAAGLAALQALQEEKLAEQVKAKEQLFRSLLVHPGIKKVSGKGLLLALEFDSYEQNKRIIDACIANGVLTDWFLFNAHSMRIAPPLIITEAEIRKACEVILACIDEVAY